MNKIFCIIFISIFSLTIISCAKKSWKWTNDAAKYGCGESVWYKANTTRERLKFEHCWEHKIYDPYPSLPDSNTQYSEPNQEQIQQAEQLADKGWNKQVSSPAEYFVATDVSESGKSIVKAGIQLAESYLGNWGPLRVYIIGNDVDATKSLVQNFCNWSYQYSYVDYCVKHDQGVEIREIAIFNGSNAFAKHSRKLPNPTQAFVIGNPLKMANEAAKVAVHEYVHIYTAAHQLYINADSFGGDWPIWLEEGAAEFLALYLSDQKSWLSFEKRMKEALDIARSLRSLVPGLTIADLEQDRDRVRKYCGLCMGQLQYETGQWATLWLVARTSIDVVFLEFFPSVYSMGLPQAFEKYFGLTIDQFHLEFEDFMASPYTEQRKLLTHMMYLGDKDVGKFKDGKFDGQETWSSTDGEKYQGEWKYGKEHGQGTWSSTDGKYEGEFKWGEANGQGTWTSTNGNMYVGEWKDWKEHGQGTWSSTDGEKYQGEWKYGKEHGQGTWSSTGGDGRFTEGEKYEGEFKDGRANGQGTWSSTNGSMYVGEWKDWKEHGQGIRTWSDGDKYVGEFKNGKIHGQGTYTFPDGKKEVGVFMKDQPWNITAYDKDGNILFKYLNGEHIKQ